MAYYLYQATYTADALKALLKQPGNRSEVVRKAVEELGGKLEGAWFSFGEFDVVLIAQMPDNVTVAAFALAVAAAGTVHGGKTTPLMTLDEGLAAMKKAGASTYRAPGK
jgi:uncharacterized protein with GYD domain